MTNIQDFLHLREDARVLIPVLGKFAVVLQSGSEISWEHFNVANIPQYNVPLGFNVLENQRTHLVAYHEPFHEYEEYLRLQDPQKKHRQKFLTLIGETQSWDSLKAAADALTASGKVQAGHDADPGEWWADAGANSVAGVPKVGPLKVQNTAPLKLRTFFQGLVGITPPAPASSPLWEWVPAKADRWTPGRGAVVDTIVLHSTATTMAGAIATFTGGARMVSAHLIIDVNRIVQMVDLADTAWHCGDWPWNQRSVGIEHVDNGDSWGVRPESLYANAIFVSRAVRAMRPITQMKEHRSIVATACPAGLDVPRIISGVMLEMAFDPRANATDLAFLDQRIRDIIMNEPQLTGYALRRALVQYGLKPAAAEKIAAAKKRGTRADILKGHGRGK